MKKFSLLIILSLLFVGCSSDSYHETSAIIWLSADMKESFLFDIYNNKVDITTGNVILDTTTGEVFYGNNIKTKTYQLNSKNNAQVSNLLSEIKKEKPGIINPGNDTTEVFALIENNLYWTPYYHDTCTNRNLLELTEILTNLTE